MLATNVAETSLTVPGIRYVIDPGTARISRYSHRTKVQRLPIEPVSQASANQRKGRCGRTADGICIRLYSEEDFLPGRSSPTPEILRTNLASVILQMTAAGLGDIAKFPFIDPPDRRNIKDGVQLLEELGALDPSRSDPREAAHPARPQARPAAGRPAAGPHGAGGATATAASREVMVIAAALSIQDPRERPADKQQQADQQHARFADESSRLPRATSTCGTTSASSRRSCPSIGLPPDVPQRVPQLPADPRVAGHLQPAAQVAKQHGHRPAATRGRRRRDHVHTVAARRAALAHRPQGRRAKNEYLGARSAKFAIFPGSALFKKPPRWVMSAELVETSRLWARVERARSSRSGSSRSPSTWSSARYSEPHWEKKQAAVMALREGDALRRPDRRPAQGQLRPDRPGAVAASCSSATRWSRATGAPTTSSSTTTASCSTRSRSSSTGPGAATSWSTTRRSSTSTTSGSRPTSCPARTSTPGGSRSAATSPDLLNFEHSMLVNEAAEAVTKDDYPDSWRQGELKFR